MTTLTMNKFIGTASPSIVKRKRIESIDLLRGIVMIIMALDHVRDYFHYDAFLYDPMDLSHTNMFLFFTRFITHYCAPVFVFLAGISAYLYGVQKSKSELAYYLFTRGIWLVFVELFIISLALTFNPSYPMFNLQVIWAIGISMIVLSAMIFMNRKFILLTAVVLIAGHNLLDVLHVPGTGFATFLWSFLHEPGDFVFGHFTILIRYPVIPWIGVIALGYYFGSLYNSFYDPGKRMNLEKFTDEYQPFNIGYDDLDKTPASDFFKKEGASKAAQEFLGGQGESALFKLWYAAILKLRGVPVFPTDVHRLKGGNQKLPDAFAKKLGVRVWLSSPIMSIKNSDTGITVTYKNHNEEKQLSADYFVNCIPLPAFRNITVQPAMSAEKQYVFENLTYDSYSRFVFQASSKFWLDDGLPNINLFLEHPDLGDVWHSADEVDTHRVIVLGTGPGGVSPQRALAAFREVYPGKKDTIELAIGRDWTKETFSSTCERLPFPVGQLKKFWPHVMKPEGRIHFAGAYADNLNWGTEAATRSANRVANEIDKA